MRLVVIEASTFRYAVYEDRERKAVYQAPYVLDAVDVEDLRANPPYLLRTILTPNIPDETGPPV